LPSTIANPTTHLSENSVRRSARLNKAEGFCAIRLEREPAKKRKISIVQIDEKTGEARPVPLAILQGWGINCGLAPSELTNEVLMQEPSASHIEVEDADDNLEA